MLDSKMGKRMKTLIGLACLVLAIFLTPAAWDVLVNGSAHAEGRIGQAVRLVPAAIAWMVGLWLVASRPNPEV